jgi:hypothetical protein
MAVLLGMSGLDGLDGDAEPEPPGLERLNRALGLAKGHCRSGWLKAAFAKEPLESRDGSVLSGRLQGFAQEQEARGMVGDGEGIAISAAAKPRL